MKQLLFLLLFPYLALAQYTGNAGQKITLGEQTTADGLVFRGAAADTVTLKITKTNKQDTSTYLLLDTLNNVLLKYNIATTYWTRLNLLPTDTTSMLTNYYRSGRALGTPLSGTLTNATGLSLTTGVTGTLAVANGGTNASTFTAGSVVFAGASGTYSQDNSGLFYNSTNDYLGVATASPNYKLHVKTGESGRTNHDSRMKIQIESELEAYYSINVPSGGYGGFRVHTTASAAASAVFEYWAPNKKFYFLTGGFYEFNDKNNNKLLTIDSTGFIGINQVTPTERLHVVGNARITAMNGINDIGASATGVLQAATSDMNLKNTIENSPFGLNEILLLNPVTFLYNDENRKIDSDVKEVGFIAQDVYDVIPNAVSSTGTGDLQLDYRAITASLVKAIKEQNLLIKALEQRILILENK